MTERDGGNLYDNIKYELDEIAIAHNQLMACLRAMHDEIVGRNPSGAAQYAAEAAVKAKQIETMLDHIAKVLRRDGHTVATESVNDSAA